MLHICILSQQPPTPVEVWFGPVHSEQFVLVPTPSATAIKLTYTIPELLKV